jgi:ABC-type antimicrobial peptide transport system permease subunit
MGYSKFNSIFNTNYNVANLNEFVPITVTLKYYDYYDIDRAKLVYSVDLNITKLTEGDAFYVSDEMCKNLLEITTFTTSLYFDDLSNIESISKVAVENGYIMNSLVASALTTITKAVNVFSDFFIVIFVGLCLCAVSILANYGLKLVKERKYEIGILKALGTRDRDLVCIFGIQIILEIILIVFMYNLGSILFVDLSNDILIRSLMELAPNNLVVDVEILFINLKDLISNSILAMFIVIVSFVLPIIKLRKLKPLDIVKAKE